MTYLDSPDGELRLKNQFSFEYPGSFGVWRPVTDLVVPGFSGSVPLLFVSVDPMIAHPANTFERAADWECNTKQCINNNWMDLL